MVATSPLRLVVSHAWENIEIRDRVLTVLSAHQQLQQKAKKAIRVCKKHQAPLQLHAFGKFYDVNDVTVFLFIIAQDDDEHFFARLRDFERAIDNFLHQRKAQH